MGFLGNIFAQPNVSNPHAYISPEDNEFKSGGVYSARPDEYFDQYLSRMNRQADDMIATGNPDNIRRGNMLKNTMRAWASDPAKYGSKFKGGGKSQGDEVQGKIDAFYQRMTSPLDANDPEVKNAMMLGRNMAGSEAANRGIEGGLSIGETQRASLAALQPLQQQRNNLAMGALSLTNARDLQKYQDRTAQERYDYNMSRQKIQQGYGLANQNQQNFYGTIGRNLTGPLGAIMGLKEGGGGGGGGRGGGGGGGGGGVPGSINQYADIGESSWRNNYNAINYMSGGGYVPKGY